MKLLFSSSNTHDEFISCNIDKIFILFNTASGFSSSLNHV